MKSLITILFAIASFHVAAQSVSANFDKALAQKLGADEYGMRSYVMGILKTGPTVIDDQEKMDDLFRGHMDNIQKMSAKGELVVAGPFKSNDQNYRGMYIFNVKSREEAEMLLKNDPMIAAKVMVVELYDWYGSAALGEYIPVHNKIEQRKP